MTTPPKGSKTQPRLIDPILHSTVGQFTAVKNLNSPPGGPNGGNMCVGGHSQTNIDELNRRGIKYQVKYTYANGVRIGGVQNHTSKKKNLGNGGIGQSWFPDSWDEDKILIAGTTVANSSAPIMDSRQIGIYENVAVKVIYNAQTGEIGTICPDYEQDLLEGVTVIE